MPSHAPSPRSQRTLGSLPPHSLPRRASPLPGHARPARAPPRRPATSGRGPPNGARRRHDATPLTTGQRRQHSRLRSRGTDPDPPASGWNRRRPHSNYVMGEGRGGVSQPRGRQLQPPPPSEASRGVSAGTNKLGRQRMRSIDLEAEGGRRAVVGQKKEGPVRRMRIGRRLRGTWTEEDLG